MPQMSPLSWLSLFIIFSITLIIFNMLNYFLYLPPAPKKNNNKAFNMTTLNWKW
nr:ATP synthase F0 subunit 8 [Elephantomyia inulta]